MGDSTAQILGRGHLWAELHSLAPLSCTGRVKGTLGTPSRCPVSSQHHSLRLNPLEQVLSGSAVIRMRWNLLKIHLFWQHSQKLDFRGSGGEGKTRPGDSDDHGCLEVAPLPPAQGRDQISGLVHNRYLFIYCNTFLMLSGMNRRIRQERARLKCAHPLPFLCPGWPAVNSCQPTTGCSGWTGQP